MCMSSWHTCVHVHTRDGGGLCDSDSLLFIYYFLHNLRRHKKTDFGRILKITSSGCRWTLQSNTLLGPPREDTPPLLPSPHEALSCQPSAMQSWVLILCKALKIVFRENFLLHVQICLIQEAGNIHQNLVQSEKCSDLENSKGWGNRWIKNDIDCSGSHVAREDFFRKFPTRFLSPHKKY